MLRLATPRALSLVFCLLWIWGGAKPCGATDSTEREIVLTGDDFQVRSWLSEDGLPGNVVRSVRQSSDGYLWVATAEGIVRFDGLRFHGFSGDPDRELSRLPARRIFTTKDGTVWVATAHGGLLRWHDGKLRRVLAGMDWPNFPEVTQVMLGENASFHILRGEEIWRWDPTMDTPLQVRQPEDSLRVAFAENLARAAENGRTTPGNPLPSLRDRRGVRWQGQPGGGLAFRTAEGSPWIQLPGFSDRIGELYLDRDDTVWAACETGGLRQILRKRVRMLGREHGLSDSSVLAIKQRDDGAWWISPRSGGLELFANGSARRIPLALGPVERPVSALFEDRGNRLWVATRDGAVFSQEEDSFEAVAGTLAHLSKVNAICQTEDGTLWFGGSNGLQAWDGTRLVRPRESDGVPRQTVSALASGDDDILWIGYSRGMVVRGKRGNFRTLTLVNEASRQPISCLLPAPGETCWVATLGAGLLYFDGKGWRRFTTDDGLPDDRITWLLFQRDQPDWLWVATLGGIARVSASQLAGGQRPGWLRLDRGDGLKTRECSGGFQPAGWQALDGSIHFPTSQGIARLHPREMDTVSSPPLVSLESCRVNGTQIPVNGDAMVAGPGRVSLEFRYTALSFLSPQSLRFRVRLKGLEEEWRDLGNTRSVSFESVPAGRYRFEVMAVNGEGLASIVPAGLELRVLPYFWETSFFKVCIGLALLALATGSGWGLARLRLKRRLARLRERQAQEAERSRIARDLHDDLGATLTGLVLQAELAAEETGHAPTSGPLSGLAASARRAVGALDEIVWAANPKHDSVTSLVNYLAANGIEMLGAAGITLGLDIPPDLPEIPLEPERRHALYLACREAFHNIVKHSGAKEATLSIGLEGDKLAITISDRGRGFDTAAVTPGDGLDNMHRRLEPLGGTCTIRSADGAGTRVHLRLPVHPNAS